MNKLIISQKDKAVKEICAKDPMMKQLITMIGDIEINLRRDYLSSLVRSIVGQQISVSAASAIYERLKTLLDGEITAKKLHEARVEDLKKVGLSKRKGEYVKDLAKKTLTNELDLMNINKLTNEEIIHQLINVKGIGKWTAEVFLILTLGRMDVLAIDDVGIQRAASWLYDVDKSERRQILIDKTPCWKPYRSVVSFYLWEAIHLDYISKYRSFNELVKQKNKSS